jgi:hypothetical protein
MQPVQFAIVAILALAPTVCVSQNEAYTLTAEIRAQVANAPPGSSRWETRYVLIPDGCEYISHEIELLEETPQLPSDGVRLIFDELRQEKSYVPPGWAAVLSVGIAAHRSPAMEAGPALIAVRLSVTASCEDLALELFRRKFAIETLDFSR